MIWALIYRTINMLRWGVGIGTDLTAEQIDKNFGDLEERVWTLETNPPDANGIATIVQVGSQLTVWLQDGTALGPFILPRATIRFRGQWLGGQPYFEGDLVLQGNNGLYFTNFDHVSEETFNPDQEESAGIVYTRIIGPVHFATTHNITDDDLGAGDSITLTLDQVNFYFRTDTDEDLTIIIPANADVPFDIDTEIGGRQCGAGAVLIEGAAGVQINGIDGCLDKTAVRGATWQVKKVATDEWDLAGYLLKIVDEES